jgi:hypothetical protein
MKDAKFRASFVTADYERFSDETFLFIPGEAGDLKNDTCIEVWSQFPEDEALGTLKGRKFVYHAPGIGWALHFITEHQATDEHLVLEEIEEFPWVPDKDTYVIGSETKVK